MKKATSGNKGYRLRSGLHIYPEHERIIERMLGELTVSLPARLVLLTDVAGQVVTVKGESGSLNLPALGSLVAGDLAASQEIARLTGEYQDYQIVLREGQTSHTLITEVGDNLAILAQVSHDVALGWARMLIRQTANKLALELERVDYIDEADSFQLDFSDEGEGDLSDLFSDALEDLWQE